MYVTLNVQYSTEIGYEDMGDLNKVQHTPL